MTDTANRQRPQAQAKRYLSEIPIETYQSFSPQQLTTVEKILTQALSRSKPKPKLVDLRFVVDLFFAKYYVVLFVGRDQRTQKRKTQGNKISQVGNVIAAILLLLSLNLLISSIVLLMAYLLKSAAGINLFPGHLGIPN